MKLITKFDMADAAADVVISVTLLVAIQRASPTLNEAITSQIYASSLACASSLILNKSILPEDVEKLVLERIHGLPPGLQKIILITLKSLSESEHEFSAENLNG